MKVSSRFDEQFLSPSAHLTSNSSSSWPDSEQSEDSSFPSPPSFLRPVVEYSQYAASSSRSNSGSRKLCYLTCREIEWRLRSSHQISSSCRSLIHLLLSLLHDSRPSNFVLIQWLSCENSWSDLPTFSQPSVDNHSWKSGQANWRDFGLSSD